MVGGEEGGAAEALRGDERRGGGGVEGGVGGGGSAQVKGDGPFGTGALSQIRRASSGPVRNFV